MKEFSSSHHPLLQHLFRSEYNKMTAVLCRHFGLQQMQLAEDLVSETFLKAVETWDKSGVPENPAAWLYTVASNKTKDYLKRVKTFETRIAGALKTEEQQETDICFTEQHISDSQLAMIFAICDPVNSAESQVCLALQVLCGFSVEEIANAFLTSKETIKKRLLRARAKLRNDQFKIVSMSDTVIQSRLDVVLTTLYLLFNEGYFSKTSDQMIRKDLCLEAIRLTLILTQHASTNTTSVNALLALMCYQSSRLDARTNDEGEAVLFEQQDRGLWDQDLIDKGNYYLVNACSGNEVSKYHLEAGIAYWHIAPENERKWEYILQLYNELIVMEYSAVTALNRTFAFAKVYGYEQGRVEAERLGLEGSSAYHALLGYLYADGFPDKAVGCYNMAVALTKSVAERRGLLREVRRLEEVIRGM